MRWVRFGRWPSTHDLDVYLDADESQYRQLEQLAGEYGIGAATVAVEVLPLADELVRLGHEHGLPLDVFLTPSPGGLSVAAWIEPPWTMAFVNWRGTHDWDFFGSSVSD